MVKYASLGLLKPFVRFYIFDINIYYEVDWHIPPYCIKVNYIRNKILEKSSFVAFELFDIV